MTVVRSKTGRLLREFPTAHDAYAHALGRYLHDTGRTPPRDVRMGRGDSIRCNDMRFTFKAAAGRIEFERIE